MRLTRVAFKLVAAALAIFGVEALGTSVATADTTIPNQYDAVAASNAGLNTFIRDVGNPRTGQLLIHANQLTSVVGQNIDGISFRLFIGSIASFPASNATWADYTIRVGPGVAFGSQTTTFASNFAGPPTIVRTGPLTIPANAFPGAGGPPRPFGPFIPFTTPYTYTGGNLLVEIRHTGSNITNNALSDFLEVALTTDPGFNVQFWGATATGAAATTGALANFTVARLRTVSGAPTVNAGDVSVPEGNSGTSDALVPVTLTSPAVGPVTVNFATADGTATAGTDYTATSGTLTFAPGQTSQNVTVSVTGDLAIEADETFFVNLTNPVGANPGDMQGQGTITNDDLATLSVGDASVVEGDSGTVTLNAPVTLSAPSAGPVTVAFATADNTATAGSDYTATSGVLTFAPGTTALNVTVSVIGDTLDESDETFFVNLSSPTNATIADAQGLETILDDDGADTVAELSHGFKLVANLSSAGGNEDTDVYPISQNPYSSYEVVVDEASGDVTPVELERLDAASSVIQTSEPVGTGTARSLRWANDTSNVIATETVRVASGGCSTDCGSEDTYRVRAYETTYAIPRFNNTGTQVTVLILQNPTNYLITANAHFWDPAGTRLHTETIPVSAKNTVVIVTSSITAVNNQAGSVTVTHNGRYSDLSGKAVALEPATGFSFDSPMLVRVR
jgi:hypothetical protein